MSVIAYLHKLSRRTGGIRRHGRLRIMAGDRGRSRVSMGIVFMHKWPAWMVSHLPEMRGFGLQRRWRESLLRERCKNLFRPAYHNGLCLLITLLRRVRGDWQGLTLIDPLSVRSTVNKRDRTLKRNDMWHFGSVCGGDWDVDGVPVQEYGNIYTILKQRIEGGLEYDDIPEFRQNLDLVHQGRTPENCRSEAQYRDKCASTERLYWTIKSGGYKTQRQLKALRPLNEIRVQVDRNGHLLFEEGIHRLVVAQLLGLEQIPVIVTRQHADWVARNGRWKGRKYSRRRSLGAG